MEQQPFDLVNQCVGLIVNPDNIFTTIGYGVPFVVLGVFAFIKKSLPSFILQIVKEIVNAIPKKK